MGFRGTWKNKRDANEPVIVQQFEAMGVVVERMDKPVDLLCLHMGLPRLVEVKAEGAREDKRQVAQNEFLRLWPVDVVHTIQDVRDAVDRWIAEAGDS